MKEHALQYVQQWGWPVFPVTPGAKTPLTAHGFHDASTDSEQIEAWWTQWPDANIGIPTGAVSGLIAIDADVKNGQPGKESFYKLKLPHTRTSRTPTGGWHAIYKYPGVEIRNRTGLLPGIDVRGDGGYIVVPPSKVNGAYYSWLNELEPVAVPEALLKRLTSKPTQLQVANGAQIGEGRRNE